MEFESEEHTITFTILDETYPMTGPHEKVVENLTYDVVEKTIYELLGRYEEYLCDGHDTLYWFGKEDEPEDIPRFVRNVANSLIKKKYWVANMIQKYYIVAFAVDHQRFSVWSRDYKAELINWKGDDGKYRNNLVIGIPRD